MDATDVRDQGSDAEDNGASETAGSGADSPSAGTGASGAAAADQGAADGMNLTDLLTDLGKVAQDTAATISDTVGDGEAAVRAGLEEAESTIRQHPLLAVGIAAGVGFVLGLLLRGSGQSDDD